MNIRQSATRALGNLSLKAKANQPHILFAGGLVGVVASHILVARATLKLEPVVDEIRNDLDTVRSTKEDADDEREYFRDLTFVYMKSAKSIGRLYGPAFIVGTVSIACLTKSHVDMTKRNAALAAAYTGLAQAFEEYRGRVREEVGDDKELDIYLGATEETVDENGKKKKVSVLDGKHSRLARFFNRQTSWIWEPDPEKNRYTLQMQQNYWNSKLHQRGHVFLNEVYDSLGLERSREGTVLGWLVDGDGAGYIDFGLYDASGNVRFSDPSEWEILLDFNVDPTPIHNRI